MVIVAEMVKHLIVVQAIVGSIPTFHTQIAGCVENGYLIGLISRGFGFESRSRNLKKKDENKFCILKKMCYICTRIKKFIENISRGRAVVARKAHNL